ncbi:MAG TPA: class I SAM-dependent methyltransferase [Pyrinomonadaceae bacterium]|jgi:ubiquinone/menaquinone biosynthesis C-methylase UbiE
MTERDDYDKYIRGNWARFVADPTRARALLDAVSGMEISRVLDVGCGAGQQLLPFVTDMGARGFGLDPARDVGIAARQLFDAHAPGARVAFVRGSAEQLPFSSGNFDLVICRLVLPYTDNVQTLSEIARVLKRGGALLLKILHPRFYLRQLGQGFAARDLVTIVYSVRVLYAGALYRLTGRQPTGRLTAAREVFQTEGMLRRELERQGLAIKGELPDSDAVTPSFLIIKER